MKICKSCNVIISDRIAIKHNNQSLLCRYCYRDYQAEQFKFWYDKQPKKNKCVKECIICKDKFETTQSKSNVCRKRECKLKKKILLERIRKNKKGLK